MPAPEHDRVLLIEGGTGHQTARVTVGAARALRASGERVEVLTWNDRSLAAASGAVARVHRVAGAQAARAAFAEAAPASLGALATSDAAMLALDLPGSALIDKRALQALATTCGVPVPPTETFEDASALLEARPGLPYPVMVKPATGKPVLRADSNAELDRVLARFGPGTALLVQPVLAGHVRAVAGLAWGGHILAIANQVALRAWPAASGTTTAAITVGPDPRLESWAGSLVAGHDGPFQAQFLDGHLLDLNLRPYGSLPLAAAAGANLLGLWANLRRGRQPRAMIRARPGVRYRWLEGDIRLAAARAAREPTRVLQVAWEHRPHPGTVHGDAGTETDLGPTLARLGRGRHR